MVSAVGSVGTGQTAYNAASGPELAQLQKELSDCVNCDSAKTSQGQTQIAQLSARIAALQQRDQHAERPVGALAASVATKPADGPLGTQLDVYA